MANDHTYRFYRDDNGELRVSTDAPGVSAVSAPIDDPMLFIVDLCDAADLEYDEDALPDRVVISRPPGS